LSANYGTKHTELKFCPGGRCGSPKVTLARSIRQNEVMRGLVLLIVMGSALCALAQAPVAGTVQPSVAVTADPSNSYALYLPSSYSAQKHWPLLLVFDPFGRGETGVKLFHEAAEKHGFIVVGSNNSRNFQDPSNAIRLLWADVKERHAIDP